MSAAKKLERLRNELKPEQAIIVYMSEGGSDYYLETHPINDKGQLLEGKPLEESTIISIVEAFNKNFKVESTIKGIMPANLLSYSALPGGKYSMVWYRQSEYRNIYFAEQLHIQSGRANVPAMIYKVENGSLNVFAFLGGDVSEETKLYRAPFHNVSTDGTVCLGSGKVKKPTVKTYESVMKYWEDMFWLTEFSHLNAKDSPIASNLNIMWENMVQNNHLTWNEVNQYKPSRFDTLKKIL